MLTSMTYIAGHRRSSGLAAATKWASSTCRSAGSRASSMPAGFTIWPGQPGTVQASAAPSGTTTT
jgi:hypothetical protein